MSENYILGNNLYTDVQFMKAMHFFYNNFCNHLPYPTRSLGINLSSDPCLRKMFPEIN